MLNIIRSKFQEDGSTLLHWAAEDDCVEIVELLLQLDPSTSSETGRNSIASLKDTTSGMTPLHAAAMMGSERVLILLLSHDLPRLLLLALSRSPLLRPPTPNHFGFSR